MKMRILITGARGSLGSRLMSELSAKGEHQVVGFDLPKVDVTDADATFKAIETARPDVVIHCAAYTDVDGCARDPDRAVAVNGYGTRNVAQAAQAVGAFVVYISTNEVFDGKASSPYLETDEPRPINPYGYSKWLGEQFIRGIASDYYAIVRTSWLFAHDRRNFIHVIRERAEQGTPLRVVTDEVACPTYTNDLAEALIRLIEAGATGVFHLVNEGYVSRYDFARRILELSGMPDYPIEPILSSQYERDSRPPLFTPLANTAAAALGIRLRPWDDALAAFMTVESVTGRDRSQ